MFTLHRLEQECSIKKAGVSEDEFVSHKYILSGDNHKYVTWSMRFVNKEVADTPAFLAAVQASSSALFKSAKLIFSFGKFLNSS